MRGGVESVSVESKKRLKKSVPFYFMLIIPMVFYVVFRYLPLAGNIIAFRRFRMGGSIYGTGEFTLRYFEMFLSDPTFYAALRNTLILNAWTLAFAFPLPIIFVLLLNEVQKSGFKRLVQTVSYLPRFVSTVVVVSIVMMIGSPSNGIINTILVDVFNGEAIFFANDAAWFRPLYVSTELWQFMGWNSIIYFASLSAIDPTLYEASMIDGANRFERVIHVTLQGIKPTIIINFIISVGYLMTLSFDKIFLLWTPQNSTSADVLDMLVFRMGLQLNNFSYAAAIGLFSSLVALILVASSNYIARKLSDTSLF